MENPHSDQPDIRLVTASDKIVMDADTAAFLTSPEHLEKMLERMGHGEVRAGLADCKKILPLEEAA